MRSGVVSLGSLYNYTHAHKYLVTDNTENDYVLYFLPVKLAIEKMYIEKSSFFYDLVIIVKTVFVIIQMTLGKSSFKELDELELAIECHLLKKSQIK